MVARWLDCAIDNRVVAGSNHTGASWKLPIFFTQLSQCISEETIKAVGPFYLVSRPGEVKDPTRGKCFNLMLIKMDVMVKGK